MVDVTPFTGLFPPLTYTTMTKILKSYLYQEYNDDDDLQVFVNAYNEIAQEYATWFATILLPVYAQNPAVNGSLLDWIALGLYGMLRPTLASGNSKTLGPFDTAMFNQLMFNQYEVQEPTSFFVTDDDVFKRILTWHLYKGDGKLFNIRWLKRRLMRFLTGTDGGPGQTDQTYIISITFGTDNQVNINIQTVHRVITDGALFNSGMFNQFEFNELGTVATFSISNPLVPVLKEAIDAGVLELPFQFTYVVNIN